MTTTNIIKGKAWVFGDNINTDIIIPFRFKSRTNDPYELAKYAMYGYDPDFHKKISKNDIIVAGRRILPQKRHFEVRHNSQDHKL
jgi:3-isopropylmalate/(R)-2-methylmalate dehydratase small subunit